jgi:DNA replicative helicase MCM subunit Mcm2 (Cdc46/Mcm family)
VRQLEAIIRIAESRARMDMQPVASPAHVAEAIRLFQVSTMQAATSTYVMCPPSYHVISTSHSSPNLLHQYE